MTKSFSCDKLGIPCKWMAFADTEEELLKKGMNHAGGKHGIKEMNEKQLEMIKEAIKDIS